MLLKRDGTWYWMNDAYPAQDVTLGGADPDNVLILDVEDLHPSVVDALDPLFPTVVNRQDPPRSSNASVTPCQTLRHSEKPLQPLSRQRERQPPAFLPIFIVI